jgi:hypothetical protein
MTREMALGRNERRIPNAASSGRTSSGSRTATGNIYGEPDRSESTQEERQPSHNETDYLIFRGESYGTQPTTSNRAASMRSQAHLHKALSSEML